MRTRHTGSTLVRVEANLDPTENGWKVQMYMWVSGTLSRTFVRTSENPSLRVPGSLGLGPELLLPPTSRILTRVGYNPPHSNPELGYSKSRTREQRDRISVMTIPLWNEVFDFVVSVELYKGQIYRPPT